MKMLAKYCGIDRIVEVPTDFLPAITVLEQSQRGAICWIKGHKPQSDFALKPAVIDRKVITKFDYERFNGRKAKAIGELSFEKAVETIGNTFGKTGIDINKAKALFESVKNTMVEKLVNPESRDQEKKGGNDRNYCYIGSVKCHLKNRKGKKADGEFNGKMIPVDVSGKDLPCTSPDAIFEVDGLILSYIQLDSRTIEEGTYDDSKSRNSSEEVLMKEAIENAIGDRYKYRTLNLAVGNYTTVEVNHNQIEPEFCD